MTYNKELKPFARENRNNSTFGEILLWKNLLSRKQTGYQFNRQYSIENFIVDFISRSLKLVIEVDGYSHQFKYDTDIKRDKRLNELGYKVIRFTEHDVKYDFENVRRALNIYIEELIENESIPLAPFSKGEEQEFTLAIIASKEETESIPLAPFSKGEEQEFTLAIIASKEETNSIPLAPFSKGEEQEFILPIIVSKEETESIPLAPFSTGEEQEFTLPIIVSKEETNSIPRDLAIKR